MQDRRIHCKLTMFAAIMDCVRKKRPSMKIARGPIFNKDFPVLSKIFFRKKVSLKLVFFVKIMPCYCLHNRDNLLEPLSK